MEFDLIVRHFKTPFAGLAQANGDKVLAGIGDDCAALQPTPGNSLYVSTDTLVEGVHFFDNDPAQSVGWKSLACNLSDLAACGAEPLGFTLNLSLPEVDHDWLAGFSGGLAEIAQRYNCPLVGGDTTSAGSNTAKTITITVLGQAPVGHSGFHRRLAQPGDDIWCSGTPGLARLGLLLEYERRASLASLCNSSEQPAIEMLLRELPATLKQAAVHALHKPVPRLQLGRSLRGLAHAALDLSDGLGGDLEHINHASGLRANLNESALASVWMTVWPTLATHPLAGDLLKTLVFASLTGGDDFELCWTAHPGHRDAIQSLEMHTHHVGEMVAGQGIFLIRPDRTEQPVRVKSYNHFSRPDL